MIDLDRRRFLQLGLGAAGAAALAGCAPRGRAAERPPESRSARRPAPNDRRLLVVLEMAGGHDGISMAIPYTDPAYRARRSHTAVDLDRVLPVDDTVALHPRLGRLHARGLAIVAGVGVARPDLSHFEMLRRWWAGSPDGDAGDETGFLGRICDAVGDASAPAVGLSLGTGPTPALTSRKVVTLSLDPGGDGRFPRPDDERSARAWIAGQRAMAQPDRADAALAVTARTGTAQAVRFSDVAAQLPKAWKGYPKNDDLGAQFSLAARALAADIGVRVVHVPWGADFDTHENHRDRHDTLMQRLDANLDAFLTDLERRSLAERVLVASVSEFGRRVPDNGSSGLDHGAASMLFLAGPVRAGVHGEVPRLDALDADENLRPTVEMADYYATLAEGWLGIPAADVLPGCPRPIVQVIA